MSRADRPFGGYRPMPRDFPEVFARVGWEGIEFETNAHKTTVRRWCDEYGYDKLKTMRREYLEEIYAKRGHRIPGRRPRSTAGRYVMGLRRKIVWPCRSPRFWDFAFMAADKVERPVRERLLTTTAVIEVAMPELPFETKIGTI